MQEHQGSTQNFKSDEGARRDYPVFSLPFESSQMNAGQVCISCTFERKCALNVTQSGSSRDHEDVKIWISEILKEQMCCLQ